MVLASQALPVMMAVLRFLSCNPAFQVTLSPFAIGKHEVSNARFQAFVDATGYKTEAEQFGNRQACMHTSPSRPSSHHRMQFRGGAVSLRSNQRWNFLRRGRILFALSPWWSFLST